MKTPLRLGLLVLVFNLALTQIPSASSMDQEEVKERLERAYEAVAEAERAGGDVSGLVDELNQALELLEVGGEDSLAEALSKVDSVLTEAPGAMQAGIVATQLRYTKTAAVVGLLGFSAVLVWRYGPRIFWSIWLRSKKSWRVHA